MESKKNEIGRKLKKLRKDRDLTQEDLGNIMGVTKQVISRYERGDRQPRWATIMEYAKRLEIDPKELLDSETAYDDITDKDIIDNVKMFNTSNETEVVNVAEILKECGISVFENNEKIFLMNTVGGVEVSKDEVNELLLKCKSYTNLLFNEFITQKLKKGFNI